MKRIIHRIFFDFYGRGDPFLPYLETWEKELPDFEIMKWNENNLPLDLNKYTAYMAQTKNAAFLSDYFRCRLLKEYGGVYLDTDVEVLNGKIFQRIYDEAQTAKEYSLFMGIESNRDGGLTTYCMGAKQERPHELLDFLMRLYENVFTTSMRHVIKKFPNPDLVSLYFCDFEENEHYSLSEKGYFYHCTEPFITKNIKIYPQDYFSPLASYNNEMMASAFSENTCLCHHFSATWKTAPQDPARSAPPQAMLFRSLLENNYYTLSPNIVPALRKEYTLPKKPRTPLWALSRREIAFLEKLLNKIIPYDGSLYSFLRKMRKNTP
ncbi:MAG: hypothetical protein LBH75_00210 [Treponema sp.]|jgi:hypothetical protein|nr:hypothetical protein [Treponema sp.]